MKKILFLHGLGSMPGGTKVIFLRKKGYIVLNPAIPKNSFDESCNIAQQLVIQENPDIIVGSSRGGAVALNIDPLNARLILIAPAWTHYPTKVNPDLTGAVILHSLNDDIVDLKDSQKLLKNGAKLKVCGENHRMNDDDCLDNLHKFVTGY